MEIPVSFWIYISLTMALAMAVTYSFRITGRYRSLLKKKRGDDVRRGFTTEQWLPFLEQYPWDPTRFRFLGAPIDGIQFEEDKIVFVEFKSGESRMSNKQRLIRELVELGKVEFTEIRIDISNPHLLDIN